MKKLRILIADDHEIVRRGLRQLIESEWGWEVCGEAANGREAVALGTKTQPDVAILDFGMPELNGVEVTRELKRTLPDLEVLAFTGTESETLVRELFTAGARACVLKGEAAEHLVPAIKALSAHRPYLASRASQFILESYLRGAAQPERVAAGGLSPREIETVRLLADGKSNKEVAAALGISTKTVETHRATIMRKLGFTAFSELVRYAVRNHLVSQ